MPGFVHDSPRQPVIVRSADGTDVDVTRAYDAMLVPLVSQTVGYAFEEEDRVCLVLYRENDVAAMRVWAEKHKCDFRPVDGYACRYDIDLTTYSR